MESLLKPDLGLMIFTIVTFLLLVAMLKKFAWKPILAALEDRELKIRSDVERAEKANADAETLRQKYQAQLVEAQRTIQDMVSQAKADGERLRGDILTQAKTDADRALEKGRRELSAEADRLRGELRGEVAGLSVTIAEKILQRAVDAKVQQAVLDDALKSVGKKLMKDTAAAKRYAKALEELTQAKGGAADVLQALSNLTLALQSEPKLARLLASPLVRTEKKDSLIKAVSSNKLFLRLLALLIRRHRVELVPAIFQELQHIVDVKEGFHRALIKTASPLSDNQKKDVETTLAKRLGGKVLGRFEVSADLIGGIWMQTGDRVMDATVRGKIDSFRRTLVHSAN